MYKVVYINGGWWVVWIDAETGIFDGDIESGPFTEKVIGEKYIIDEKLTSYVPPKKDIVHVQIVHTCGHMSFISMDSDNPWRLNDIELNRAQPCNDCAWAEVDALALAHDMQL